MEFCEKLTWKSHFHVIFKDKYILVTLEIICKKYYQETCFYRKGFSTKDIVWHIRRRSVLAAHEPNNANWIVAAENRS